MLGTRLRIHITSCGGSSRGCYTLRSCYVTASSLLASVAASVAATPKATTPVAAAPLLFAASVVAATVAAAPSVPVRM
jgi:hypothetical protein